MKLSDTITGNQTVEEQVDAEARRLFRERTGYNPENCPPEIEAAMLYETEDIDD